MHIIVTTTQAGREIDEELQSFLQESQLPFVERKRKSLPVLAHENQAEGIIVWRMEGPLLYAGDPREELYFHPSMAKNRLAALRKLKQPDSFLQATSLKIGDSLLDCTMGRGADSIVAAYICGPGKVVGLESVLPVALVMKWGMRLYRSRMDWLDGAIHNIEVKHADHNQFLKLAGDNSYDVVYFDPMFRHPRYKSQPISALRQLADHRPLELEAIHQACRVARRRVVIKETISSGEFERLGCTKILSSPHNPIAYGIIDT